MLSQLISKQKINNINVSVLADEVVFALGDFLKLKKINKEIISLGIDLCEAILRGKQVNPDKMKIEEALDYEKYKLIESSGDTLKNRGLDSNTLIQKAEGIKSSLASILKGLEIRYEEIKEIQKFFITISLLFWEKPLSFQQGKRDRVYK
jgi:hypothetical protein